MKTTMFLKKKVSKAGKEYYSVADVVDDGTNAKFTWNNSLVAFTTKKGDLVIKSK